jgi:hypothetical protein
MVGAIAITHRSHQALLPHIRAFENFNDSLVVEGGFDEEKRMDAALLQDLLAGAGSTYQFVGGLIIALLYVVVGLHRRTMSP